MRGWSVPPPKLPTKTASQLAIERQLKVAALEAQGLLKSERIKAALLKVPREDFIPPEYRDLEYEEVPLLLQGHGARETRAIIRAAISRGRGPSSIRHDSARVSQTREARRRAGPLSRRTRSRA